MVDMSITFGQLSLTNATLPESSTFMDKWEDAAKRTVGVYSSDKSSTYLRASDDGMRNFIDMRRLDDTENTSIFQAVMVMKYAYLKFMDLSVCVVRDDENKEWVVIYRGVELPEEILSYKVDNSHTAFMYMHMERMRRIAFYYLCMIDMQNNVVTVTNRGQIVATLLFNGTTPKSPQYISHAYVNVMDHGSSMIIYSMVRREFTIHRNPHNTMYNLSKTLAKMFPDKGVWHISNNGTISVSTDHVVLYLGMYLNDISAARAALRHSNEISSPELYSYGVANGLNHYYAITRDFPLHFSNMYNYGCVLMNAIQKFFMEIYKTIKNKSSYWYMDDDTYVVASAPEDHCDKIQYGSMWIENKDATRIINEDDSVSYHPYIGNKHIVMLVCKTPVKVE